MTVAMFTFQKIVFPAALAALAFTCLMGRGVYTAIGGVLVYATVRYFYQFVLRD